MAGKVTININQKVDVTNLMDYLMMSNSKCLVFLLTKK